MSDKYLTLFGIVLLGCFLQASTRQLEMPNVRTTRQAVSILNRLMTGEVLTVRLKSVSTGEYLYAGDASTAKDQLRRSVFTWRDKKQPTGEWANWKMIGAFTEGKFHVRLASRKYGDEFLYAPSESELLYDPERRNVYTWRGNELQTEEEADWFLETDVTNTAKHPDRYTLLNVQHKEYLYAGDNAKTRDESRRRVFTWLGVKKDFLNNKQHMWDVELVSSSPVGGPN